MVRFSWVRVGVVGRCFLFSFFYSFLHFGDSQLRMALADAWGLRGAPFPQFRYKCLYDLLLHLLQFPPDLLQ